MTDKEKILAEVERLKDKGKYSDTYDYAFRDGNNAALYAIEKFINSLPEEPVSEDLEKASDEYAEKHPTCGLAKTSFKAGAQWQLNKIKCLVDKINVNNYNFEYLEGLYDALRVMTK